ncbi:MAG: PAC2 family protein, partial [Halobacteria archaeon]
MRIMQGVKILVDKVSVKNPVVIEGFPGIGLVGTIAMQHLIEQMEMKQIGIVASQEYFPPVVVTLGGIVNAPVRMYEQIDKGVIAVISDIPINPNVSNEVGAALIDWAIAINAREIISIAGLMTMSDEHRVYAVATNKELL